MNERRAYSWRMVHRCATQPQTVHARRLRWAVCMATCCMVSRSVAVRASPNISRDRLPTGTRSGVPVALCPGGKGSAAARCSSHAYTAARHQFAHLVRQPPRLLFTLQVFARLPRCALMSAYALLIKRTSASESTSGRGASLTWRMYLPVPFSRPLGSVSALPPKTPRSRGR
jgi:hypothetical protein